MSEWSSQPLADAIELIGGGTPRTSNPEFWNGDIPWLSVVDFNTGRKFVSDAEKKITQKGLDSSSTKLLNKGDIIISARGTVGAMAVLDKPMTFNQSCYGVRGIKGKSITDYIYYLLKEKIAELSQISHGGVFDTITRDTFKEINASLPPLPEQKAIASVLSSLDDKIDLLHRQNKTLEAMAEALFRQWFVEEAQDDWEEGTLSDLVESANTGLDAIKRAPIVDVFTGIKCLRIQDISQKKKFEDWGNSRVLEKDFEKAQLKTGDLIMARTCSPGIIYFVRENLSAVFNNGLARIRPKPNKTHSIFLYYLFRTGDFIGYISGISGGTSVQLNMKLGDLLSYKLTFPPKELQDRYHPFFQSLDNKIFINYSQIRTLETLRDTLLPKLMSGEIRLPV